jgi:hypothetical protein
VTCTFTNEQAGRLEVVKSVDATPNGETFDLLIDGNVAAGDVGDGGSTGEVSVAAGNHSVSETGANLASYSSSIECVLDGTTTVVASGSGTSLGGIPVNAGDDVLCTITNLFNQPPVVAADQDPVVADEGQTANNTGTVSDPDGDSVSLTASTGSVTHHNDGTWSWSFETQDGPADSQTVTIFADDGNGGTDQTSFDLTVNNVAPSIEAIIAPADPVNINDQPLSFVVVFTDPAVLDDAPYTCLIDYGDDSGAQVGTVSGDTCVGSHTYTEAGVYAIDVTVTDKDGASASDQYQFVVIYDPDGGFVTGGGWIDSPAGAYVPDPALTGRATFGFVSKYKKGTPVPVGNTEFHFKAADLDFHSTSYDWLIIAGHKAMYRGTGTINGSGKYGFLLSAIDAALTPSTAVDLFRIKIWDKDAGDAVIYDNQVACADDADDADPCTEIGGGAIMIHKGKKK